MQQAMPPDAARKMASGSPFAGPVAAVVAELRRYRDAGLSAAMFDWPAPLRPPDARGAGRTRCAPPSTPTRDGATWGGAPSRRTALDRRRASRRRRWRRSASSAGSGIPSARRRVASSRPRSTDASAPSGSPSRCSRSLAASIAPRRPPARAAGQRVPCVERVLDPSQAAKQVGPIDGDAAFIPWPAEGLPAIPAGSDGARPGGPPKSARRRGDHQAPRWPAASAGAARLLGPAARPAPPPPAPRRGSRRPHRTVARAGTLGRARPGRRAAAGPGGRVAEAPLDVDEEPAERADVLLVVAYDRGQRLTRSAAQEAEIAARISQPSTSSSRATPSSIRSTVPSRASSMRWRNSRRTIGSRSRWPACGGRRRRAIRYRVHEQRPVEAASVVRDQPSVGRDGASRPGRAGPSSAWSGSSSWTWRNRRRPTSRARPGTRRSRRRSPARSSPCRGRRAARPPAAGRGGGRAAVGRSAGDASAARRRTWTPRGVRSPRRRPRRPSARRARGSRAARWARVVERARARVAARKSREPSVEACRQPSRRGVVTPARATGRRRRARRAAAAPAASGSTFGSRRGPVQAGQPPRTAHAAIRSAAPASSSSWRCHSRSDRPMPPGTPRRGRSSAPRRAASGPGPRARGRADRP